MENKTNEEYLKETNMRIYEQLSYAEAKHAVLIGLIGAAIFAIVGIIIDLKDNSKLLWLQILLGIMAVSFLITLLISISSFNPARSTLNKDKKNLYFYGDIASFKNGEEYVKYIKEIDECGNLTLQLAEQNIIVSKIINRKHDKFQICWHLTIASVFLPYYIFLAILYTHKLIMKHNQNLDNKKI